MQCPHELEIKYLTWMGLEPWHSGLWVQSLSKDKLAWSNWTTRIFFICKKFSFFKQFPGCDWIGTDLYMKLSAIKVKFWIRSVIACKDLLK